MTCVQRSVYNVLCAMFCAQLPVYNVLCTMTCVHYSVHNDLCTNVLCRTSCESVHGILRFRFFALNVNIALPN